MKNPNAITIPESIDKIEQLHVLCRVLGEMCEYLSRKATNDENFYVEIWYYLQKHENPDKEQFLSTVKSALEEREKQDREICRAFGSDMFLNLYSDHFAYHLTQLGDLGKFANPFNYLPEREK